MCLLLMRGVDQGEKLQVGSWTVRVYGALGPKSCSAFPLILLLVSMAAASGLLTCRWVDRKGALFNPLIYLRSKSHSSGWSSRSEDMSLRGPFPSDPRYVS